jgi:hypothetical protein
VPLNSWTVHGRLNLHQAMSYGSPTGNVPPVANAGPDRTVTDADGDGGVMVTLDGTASSDPDGDVLSHEWSEGATVLAFTATPTVWLTVGTHSLTLKVTDDHGASATDTVAVTVNAATPVSLSVTGISPSVVSQHAGATTFVISGTGFEAGAAVRFANGAGKAPRVRSVIRDGATQLTVLVDIRPGGPNRVRHWDVVVTNPGGQTAVGAGLLTITP